MKQLSRAAAVRFHDAQKWVGMSDAEIVAYQSEQSLVCIPHDIYIAAMAREWYRRTGGQVEPANIHSTTHDAMVGVG